MNRALSILLLLLACADPVRAAAPSPGCGPAFRPTHVVEPIPDLTGKLPAPDYLDSMFRCARGSADPASTSRSLWLEADTKQYETKLSRSRFASLVLPAQTQYFGFDRTERALIGAEVADALGGTASLPDPFLVARALGEVRRRFDSDSVYRLARKTGAKQLIEIYAGHDGRMNMTMTLQLKSCVADAPCELVRQRDWRSLPFSNERPPFLVVRDLQADIRRELLDLPPLPAATAPAPRAGNPVLDVTPADLVASTQGDSAAVTALLAALVPAESELGRERLSAWALRTATRAGSGSEQRFLAAYAASELSRRPYAIKLLEGLDDPAAMTLRQLLDGNLPEAQATFKSIEAPVPKLLLAMSIQSLSAYYGFKTGFDPKLVDAAFGTAAAQWLPLVERRVRDQDGWSSSNSRAVKQLLDKSFPASAFSLRSVEQGSFVLQSTDAGDIDTANLRHLRAALTGIEPGDCCGRAQRATGAWQVYWMLEAATEANVLKQVATQLSPLGLPEAALKGVERYDPFLAGQPQFERLRGLAAVQLGESSPSDKAEFYERMFVAAEQSTAHWSQGQSRASKAAVTRGDDATQPYAYAYARDLPRRPYWISPMVQSAATEQPLSCVSLEYSSADLAPAYECLSEIDATEQGALVAALRGRFHGHPEAKALLARFAPDGEAPTDPVEELRARILENPDDWESYYALGVMLVERDGKYAEAQQVYLSFPAFKTLDRSLHVALSNHAFDSASHLYWRGQPDLSKPLYEIAARLDTGSEASITSAARLALLGGDYEESLNASAARVMRYGSPYGSRDYLSLLHVMGRGDQARDTFLQVAERSGNPQAWIGALVGDRMAGTTFEKMKAWVQSDDISALRYRGQRFAPWYVTLWFTTDRKPDADFLQLVEEIERDSPRTVESPGLLSRPHRSADGYNEGVHASALRAGKYPELAPESNVKSEYVMLADALKSFHAGDYTAAAEKFTSMADFYPIESDFTKVALPYFAFAAARTGDKPALEEFMNSLPNADLDFDVALGRAFFAAVRKDSGKAAAALERALNVRPNTDSRPIQTEYQLAEAFELVRRETGDARFDRMIIDWARKHQRIQPTHAWAYAMEAQYSRVRADVNRALAMTLYLDPASPRLKKFTAEQKAAATAWLRTNNPFTTKLRAGRGQLTLSVPERSSPAS